MYSASVAFLEVRLAKYLQKGDHIVDDIFGNVGVERGWCRICFVNLGSDHPNFLEGTCIR